jgi:hypothetical protein
LREAEIFEIRDFPGFLRMRFAVRLAEIGAALVRKLAGQALEYSDQWCRWKLLNKTSNRLGISIAGAAREQPSRNRVDALWAGRAERVKVPLSHGRLVRQRIDLAGDESIQKF